jgi:hypothetical protein
MEPIHCDNCVRACRKIAPVFSALVCLFAFNPKLLFGVAYAFSDDALMPHVERVDAQPLLLLTNRLCEGMQTIGAPFAQSN